MQNSNQDKPVDTYQWKPITESVSLLSHVVFGWVAMSNFERDLENYELRKQSNMG
jgi:hypothetical protein